MRFAAGRSSLIAGLPAFVFCLLIAGTAHAQGAGVGIKGGLTFPEFNTDDFDLDNRTGFQVGLFVGGSRSRIIGFQTEFNWLRKESEVSAAGADVATIKLDYLQIPVLLRLNAAPAASPVVVYGIIGPSFEAKLREETETPAGTITEEGFESLDVGLMFGGGVEVGPFIVEGRYSRGLRQVNKDFRSTSELKVNSFAALVGIRFN